MRTKDRVQDVASAVLQAPAPTTPNPSSKERRGRQDVRTPMRKSITLRAEALTNGRRLSKAAFAKLQSEFPEQNLNKRFVVRQLKWFRDQLKAKVPVSQLNWSRNRKECGRGCQKFTAATAQLLIDINNASWGTLSYKRLAGKLAEHNVSVTPKTVRAWCKALKMVQRRRYIRPKLTNTHKRTRLNFVLKQIDPATSQLPNFQDVAHGDEKWFYLMHDSQICRVFPDRDGNYQLPACPQVYHKSRMPKVMVLSVCARPRPEYAFDGKVGTWSFTAERLAKRSNAKTGTVAGQTMLMEDVTVDAAAYRTKVVGKAGVFDTLRQKLWWYHRDATFVEADNGVRQPSGTLRNGVWKFQKQNGTPCPEAGRSLLYQHDGARPHTAAANQKVFASHSKMKGFQIEVVTQPAQSPDLNVLDLAFFSSLQSDVSLVAKQSRKDLLQAVQDC